MTSNTDFERLVEALESSLLFSICHLYCETRLDIQTAVASLMGIMITFGILKDWMWILLLSEGLKYDVLAAVDKDQISVSWFWNKWKTEWPSSVLKILIQRGTVNK